MSEILSASSLRTYKRYSFPVGVCERAAKGKRDIRTRIKADLRRGMFIATVYYIPTTSRIPNATARRNKDGSRSARRCAPASGKQECSPEARDSYLSCPPDRRRGRGPGRGR